MKTSELTGVQLDYWAAMAEGKRYPCVEGGVCETESDEVWAPSSDWAQGGPIKERLRIGTYWLEDMELWRAGIDMHGYTPEFNIAEQHGRTELEAAMRCLVASKYGDEVPDA